MDLTIILPCAGSGSRLGLDYPKELYEIWQGVKLIDFSLMHFKKFIPKFSKRNLIIAVVISRSKIKVFEYIKKKLPGINVKAVEFV